MGNHVSRPVYDDNGVMWVPYQQALHHVVHSFMIINYWHFYITLNEVARLVKPNGELLNIVAEVALYAINPTGRKAKKQVLPLRFLVCMVFL
jgi:ubiquinone/menaquinone biosynthesis C-methylase UbiE